MAANSSPIGNPLDTMQSLQCSVRGRMAILLKAAGYQDAGILRAIGSGDGENPSDAKTLRIFLNNNRSIVNTIKELPVERISLSIVHLRVLQLAPIADARQLDALARTIRNLSGVSTPPPNKPRSNTGPSGSLAGKTTKV